MLAIVIGFLLCMTAKLGAANSPPILLPTAILKDQNGCPGSNILQSLRRNLTEEVRSVVSDEWTEVVNLDMTNSSHSCPSPWVEENTLCTSNMCSDSAFFEVPKVPYSRVRGRITGVVTGSPDGFRSGSNTVVYNAYLDGVSITHGISPRQHIWSFGASSCPCGTPPSFVGQNYFCDGRINGYLWDLEDCFNDCCTFNSPPWFTVVLPALTRDNIEVRICTDQHAGDEKVYIQKMILEVK